MRNQISKKSILLRIIAYPALFYLLICLALYLYQDSLIFYPPQPKYPSPLPDHVSEISFEHDDVTLKGWVVNEEHAKEKIVFYYGGNGEEVYHNIIDFKKIKNTCFVLVNYRGYGSSAGEPSQDKIFSDSDFIFKKVKSDFNSTTIILYGRSLGTGVATYIAWKNRPDGLVLSTPFDSLLEISKNMYPAMPISLLLKHPFMSTKYVQDVSCPTIVLYGSEDRIVPPRHTLNLIKHFNQEPTIVKIKGATHNRINSYSIYRDHITDFILNTNRMTN